MPWDEIERVIIPPTLYPHEIKMRCHMRAIRQRPGRYVCRFSFGSLIMASLGWGKDTHIKFMWGSGVDAGRLRILPIQNPNAGGWLVRILAGGSGVVENGNLPIHTARIDRLVYLTFKIGSTGNGNVVKFVEVDLPPDFFTSEVTVVPRMSHDCIIGGQKYPPREVYDPSLRDETDEDPEDQDPDVKPTLRVSVPAPVETPKSPSAPVTPTPTPSATPTPTASPTPVPPALNTEQLAEKFTTTSLKRPAAPSPVKKPMATSPAVAPAPVPPTVRQPDPAKTEQPPLNAPIVYPWDTRTELTMVELCRYHAVVLGDRATAIDSSTATINSVSRSAAWVLNTANSARTENREPPFTLRR